MKAITGLTELVKKLNKNNLITDGHIFYLSNFHKSKVGNSVANRLIRERIVERTKALSHWFEVEWKLRKPVGMHEGVCIFYDHDRNQYFFSVKKGTYDLETFKICVDKIDYLKRLGEKLSK
jgi:hypothetical protein